ncbi:MAG: histidinol phosphatase, partial [Chloroflexi bacterium]|nr:histidinol phosphatase [Chloroflexota bacterium]
AEIRLLRNGSVIAKRDADTHLMHIADKPGVYRLEAYIDFKGQKRGWIFSNPIYIR